MTQTIYLVTGASGFVGRRVCVLLREQKCTVRAIVRKDDAHLRDLGVELAIGDLLSLESDAISLTDVTHVIHCAGDAVFGNGPQYAQSNIETTKNLIRELKAQKASVQRFVFVSTIGAVDRLPSDSCERPLDEKAPLSPTSDYGRSKVEAEKEVANSGFPFVVVRPAMVVGEEMRANSHFAVFARHALQKSMIGRIGWPGQFSVVHVDDLARALLLCAAHEDAVGKSLFCAGEAVSVGGFMADCEPSVRRLPLNALIPLARWAGRLLPFGIKVMLLPALVADDSPLRSLGWQPECSAQEALAGVVERERARIDAGIDPGGQTVVTGAASGLGRALVEALVNHRKNILLVDRNEAALHELVAQFPNCRMLVADFSEEGAASNVTLSAEWQAMPVRELYSCAGIGARGAVADVALEQQLNVFRVNVLARLAFIHTVLQEMRRRHFGRIVIISSSSAFQPLPYMAAYAASNSALLSLGEACAAEVSDSGIQLLTVCPGGMQTNFQKTAGVKEVPGEKLMLPEEVAERILKAAGSPGRMTEIVSTRALGMAFVARLLPRKSSAMLWRSLMQKMR